ncbi:MAG: hypothetical protein IPH05_08950 [Flavobacteriales bacterium]|nr:hypothetical protein [Flavobacteriales bacterium]
MWAYLTESDKRAKWLASGDMDLRVGGDVNLFWLHSTWMQRPARHRRSMRRATGWRRRSRGANHHTLAIRGVRRGCLFEVVFELSEKAVMCSLCLHTIAYRMRRTC